jgi:hypothetical protein
MTRLATEPADDLNDRVMPSIKVGQISHPIGSNTITQPAFHIHAPVLAGTDRGCWAWAPLVIVASHPASLCSLNVLVNRRAGERAAT